MTTETARPLGPGDDDPRSPAMPAVETVAPLGPGDDDPRSPVKGTPVTTAAPLAPGESHPDDDVDDELEMLAPPPAGPGGVDTGPRHITHVRKPRPTIATAATPAPADGVQADSDASESPTTHAL